MRSPLPARRSRSPFAGTEAVVAAIAIVWRAMLAASYVSASFLLTASSLVAMDAAIQAAIFLTSDIATIRTAGNKIALLQANLDKAAASAGVRCRCRPRVCMHSAGLLHPALRASAPCCTPWSAESSKGPLLRAGPAQQLVHGYGRRLHMRTAGHSAVL
jgi:hypothetical protein